MNNKEITRDFIDKHFGDIELPSGDYEYKIKDLTNKQLYNFVRSYFYEYKEHSYPDDEHMVLMYMLLGFCVFHAEGVARCRAECEEECCVCGEIISRNHELENMKKIQEWDIKNYIPYFVCSKECWDKFNEIEEEDDD